MTIRRTIAGQTRQAEFMGSPHRAVHFAWSIRICRTVGPTAGALPALE